MSAVVLRGDAAHLPLPDGSVDLIVTSPPYWSLRDYRDGSESLAGQIGNEKTWREYIANLLDCTREWIRVLKPSGSIFVVIGDKWSDRGHGPNRGNGTGRGPQSTALQQTRGPQEKSLLGLPWRYAFGCMDDLGLILRAENIWSKNGVPESVEDRTRRRHEQVFHLVKNRRYFAAVDEIREPHLMRPQRRPGGHKERQIGVLPAHTYSTSQRDDVGVDGHPLGALPGSVWDIATVPLLIPEHIEHGRCCGGRKRPGCEDGLRHHAAFPPTLARRCILGWSAAGICLECGEGRRPVVEGGRKGDGSKPHKAALRVSSFDWAAWKEGEPHRITGYACTCRRPTAPTRPAVILDPFCGTGTALLVADVLGRIGVGVELSSDYCSLARWRINDPAERARALGVPKPPPVPEGQGSLFDQVEAS